MKSYDDIKDWLVSYLSKELGAPASEIPLEESLTNLGITSRQAVELTGDLEDFIGRPVDPVVAWEHPSIKALATHLAGAPGTAGGAR